MGSYADAAPFLECQAILAALEADDDGLREIMSKMLPGELGKLEEAADELSAQCHWAVRNGAYFHDEIAQPERLPRQDG